jgi:hypothetical protein
VRWIALALVGLTLTGCETTAEKSARLEHQAKLAAAHEHRTQRLNTFTGQSAYVRVLSATLLRGSEGAAAVVTLRNASSHALRGVPIAITVSDSAGRQLFQNSAAGTEAALVSVASIPARGELVWVDDQIPANGSPAAVSARVGEAPAAPGAAVPAMSVSGVRLIEDPANGVGAAGTVTNHSHDVQHALVVFIVAVRGGRPIAAARAVVPELTGGASLPFQAFFVGDPHGGTLHASAPASTTG